MNKIVQFSLIITVASLFGACCNTAPVIKCGSPNDTFHITMKSGDHGRDVTNWQCFLLEKGFSVVPPTGTFEDETVSATMRFQKSRCYGGSAGLQPTGTVTFATYAKALRAGMSKYKLIKIAQGAAIGQHFHREGQFGTRTIGTGENIFLPMKYECKDKTGDKEVTDWQAILSCLGYTSGAAGDYDTPTQTATGNFQTDALLIGVSGVTMGWVDAAHTYATAVSWSPCPVKLTVKTGGCSN